jgi:hypothetical protein
MNREFVTPTFEPEEFDGDMVDDVYATIYDLQMEGYNMKQILEHVPPQIAITIGKMKQAGYLGGE